MDDERTDEERGRRRFVLNLPNDTPRITECMDKSSATLLARQCDRIYLYAKTQIFQSMIAVV